MEEQRKDQVFLERMGRREMEWPLRKDAALGRRIKNASLDRSWFGPWCRDRHEFDVCGSSGDESGREYGGV
jgi:hypothetical protein